MKTQHKNAIIYRVWDGVTERNAKEFTMAQGEMDDFLKKYYRQLHANAMPDDVLAQLVDYKKKGIISGHQQEWLDTYFEPDPDKNNELGYKRKEVPEPKDEKELFPAEAEKLYEAFALALAGMKADSATYDDVNDANAKKFVTDWVDKREVFPIPKATDECEAGIKKIINLLKNSPEAANIRQVVLDETKKDNGDKLFAQPEDLNKLIKKCDEGKYNTDRSVQEKIQKVAQTLDSYLNSYSWDDESALNTKSRNKRAIGKIADELAIVKRSDAFSKIEIPDLTDFKEIYAKQLLDTLYLDKSVRDKFRAHDDKKITEKIDKAEGKVSWHDTNSDDYIKPKIEDTLTALEQLEKWSKDKYTDSLKKYEELRGQHLFFGPEAKEICKAIDKEKVKPSDGVKGLLDKASAIKDRLANKTLTKHFDWFIDTMNWLNKETPKALAGCWKDARKMKAVITQIILKATNPQTLKDDPDAIEKAKTAMEIMTVMKYGMLTSKTLEALKSSDISIFSDGSLSWNKNEAISFVTKAFDKSIKAAFVGLGYGVTFARNKIMMSNMRGLRFKDKDNQQGALAKNFKDNKYTLDNYVANDKKALKAEIDNKKQERTDTEQKLQNLGIDQKSVDETLKPKKAQIEEQLAEPKKHMDAATKAKEDAQKNIDKFTNQRERNEEDEKEYTELTRIINGDDIKELKTKVAENQKSLTEKKSQFNMYDLFDAHGNYMYDPQITDPEQRKAHKEQLANEIAELQNQLGNQTSEIQKLEHANAHEGRIADAEKNRLELQDSHKAYEEAVSGIKNAQNDYDAAEQDYAKAKAEYDTIAANEGYDDISNKISEFEDATKSLTEINKTLDAREKAYANWDAEHVNKVVELENHWNFLQSGKSKTMRLFSNNIQKKFDKNKHQLFMNYVAEHGLAA